MPKAKTAKYANPPIQEAVFDLRTQGGRAFHARLFQDIPEKAAGYTYHGSLKNVHLGDGGQPSVEEIGCKYISKDKKRIAQFKANGFSFSRLAVYDGWEKNYKEAMRLWEIYTAVMAPQAVSRIAARFINKFNIPPPFEKPEKYFNTYIHYKSKMAPVWRQMAYRMLISHGGSGIRSHIIFDSQINQENQSVDALFDIDVFSDSLSVLTEDKKDLTRIFSHIREIKNGIFEESITDKAREMIK